MLFLIKINNPQGDDYEMIITAKDKETAVKLFKKRFGSSKSKEEFGSDYCKSLVKMYKSEYRDTLKRLKTSSEETKNYYLNKKCYRIGDYSYSLSEAVAEDFYENALKSYIDYYYREGYSLEYHLDNDIFEVLNLTELDSGNKSLILQVFITGDKNGVKTKRKNTIHLDK